MESSLQRWQAANPIKVELEKLEQNFRKLPVEGLDGVVSDVLPDKSKVLFGVRVAQKAIERHAFDKVHYNEWTQTQRVFGSRTPVLD